MTLLCKTLGVYFFVALFSLSKSEAQNYYRTIKSGFWKDPTIWEIADDEAFSTNVINASVSPDFNSAQILIRSGHTITIDQSVTIDETIVETGATFIYGNYISSLLSVNNGTGVDLQVNGTFEDSGPFNINWTSSQASWALGENATMIRTRSTSATLWRDHYETGMSAIPASSNWIIRKQGADNPSISAIASYYGNLRIENTTTAFWNATVIGSKFIGTSSAAVIKGNMEVGTPGFYGVKFYSQNNAANLWLVKGNLLINQGSEINLENIPSTAGASGIELQGDLIVNGILSYDLPGANNSNRIIKFSGTTDQKISGTGILLLYNFVNNKLSGDLILNRSISVDNTVLLENGKIELNGNTLSLQNNSTSAITRTNGWLRSEATDNSSKLIWNIGTTIGVYEFPFGKSSTQYIPFSFMLTSGDAGMVSVSTYSTQPDNLPFPSTPYLVTNLDINGTNNSAYTIDRFWQIDKTGTSGTATLYFSYSPDECPSSFAIFVGRRYSTLTNSWEEPYCCQVQDLTNNKVVVPEVQEFSAWTLMEKEDALYLNNDFPGYSNVSENDTSILIYPSPFREKFFVSYFMEEKRIATMEIFNSLGIKLFSEKVESKKGRNYYEIDISNSDEQGMMYLQLIGKKEIRVFKILKE